MPTGKLLNNLLEQARARNINDNIIWLDRYVASEDLMMVFKCTAVYLTPFDESTPTSVSRNKSVVILFKDWT